MPGPLREQLVSFALGWLSRNRSPGRRGVERVPVKRNQFVTSPTLWRHPRGSGDPVLRSLWGLLGPRFRGDDTRLFDSIRTKHALAVIVETGLNKTELGKIILATCCLI